METGLNFAHRAGHGPTTPSATVVNASSIKNPAPASVRAAPSTPSTASLPVKVPSGPAQGAASQGFRGAPNRPVVVPTPAAKAPSQPIPKPTASSATPSTATSIQNVTAVSSIPAKPAQIAQPTRAPRGPSAGSGQTATATATKPVVAKPSVSPKDINQRPPSASGKPAANGKATPTPAASAANKPSDDKKAAHPVNKGVNGESLDKKPSTLAANGAEANKHGPDGDQDEADGTTPAAKRWSLFAKSLPLGTSEEDLKKSFGTMSEKITQVKIPWDHFNKRARVSEISLRSRKESDSHLTTSIQDFGYIDFANEADMQQALKDHTAVSFA